MGAAASPPGLDLATLARMFAANASLTALAEQVLERSDGPGTEGVWILRREPELVLAEARALERRRAAGEALPLAGVPFAVKDNIDVEGLPTTAACPGFSYRAERSAPVVRRLQAAGALLIGKTNLDQFATGLTGTRSPHGIPVNPFDPRYIVGGSSSGSAAAVSRGLVSFALGTDTAGSGRVPAAFTNLVGLKPSRGLLSTTGVVPACRSLDCVSVFGLTVEDAATVAQLAAGFDADDPYSRREAARFSWTAAAPAAFRFGVPARSEREFFGDREAEKLFEAALARLEALGGVPVEGAMEPFFRAARLLYDGPWIAERLSGLHGFVERAPEALLPITRQILEEGRRYQGVEVFSGLHQLAALQQQVSALWERFDLLAVPTTPTIYTIAQIAEEPRSLNARLGLYTNFVNLLDLAALSVPAGLRGDGLPAGLSLIGPWGSDARLAAVGSRFHQSVGGRLGATSAALPAPPPATTAGTAPASDRVRLAVVGAHLRGQPLNHQLTELGARLLKAAQTVPCYRLYRLPTTPPKPGLVRVQSGGVAVAVEVWELPAAAFGAFFRAVTPPLAIGTVDLADGDKVPGFVCEAYAADGARDISSFGGWRAFLAAG